MDLTLDVIGVVVEALRRNPTIRLWLTSISLIISLVALILWVSAPAFLHLNAVSVINDGERRGREPI